MVVSCLRYLQCGDVDWLRTNRNFCVCAAFVKQQINEKGTARGYLEVNGVMGGGVGRAGNQTMKVTPLRSRVRRAKGSVERS